MNWSSDWSENKLKDYKASDPVEFNTPVAIRATEKEIYGEGSDEIIDSTVKWDQAVKQTGQAILDLVPQLYDSQIKFIHEDVEYEGTLVGDLVVYSDWGWKVIHYPTLAKFDDPIKGAVPSKCNYPICECGVSFPSGYKPSIETECPNPNSNYTKDALLRWCDTVQTKHGQLWAILRELTPDTYNDKSDRVMKAKDQIRDWCLSVEVK